MECRTTGLHENDDDENGSVPLVLAIASNPRIEPRLLSKPLGALCTQGRCQPVARAGGCFQVIEATARSDEDALDGSSEWRCRKLHACKLRRPRLQLIGLINIDARNS